ncbi:MAG: PEP-CTERM sorting domain-containing protein [Acidobacteriaceae bacterium]|nr:PEP-CTERM sorting domain-containing protein [Acidobacteriaceae bacterium]MBV9034184.1 PEP-CTERM sorting domain-containing protein [Acidobacteriaceae bacterium]
MFTLTHKSIYQSLLVMTICLGASVTARADQIVSQTNFQPPTTLGTYVTGSDVGNPDSFHVATGPVSVVADPCTAAGGTGQCLQLTATPGATPNLFSNTPFGPGNYLIALNMAGGGSTTDVLVDLVPSNFQLFPVTAHSAFTNYEFSTTVPIGASARLQVNGGGGILVNSITVTQQGVGESPVPEPGSGALLLAAGLGFIGVAASQRFKARRLPIRFGWRP